MGDKKRLSALAKLKKVKRGRRGNAITVNKLNKKKEDAKVRYRSDEAYREYLKGYARRAKGREIFIHGVPYKVYSFRQFVKYIGLDFTTVKSWIANRFIPDTPFLSLKGNRLYTRFMMKITKKAIRQRKAYLLNSYDLYPIIQSEWEEFGVRVDPQFAEE